MIEPILGRRSICDKILPGGYIHIAPVPANKSYCYHCDFKYQPEGMLQFLPSHLLNFRDYNAVKCWENLEVNLLLVSGFALLVTCFSSISF